MTVDVTVNLTAWLLQATWGSVGWYPRGRTRWVLECGEWCGRG